MQIHEITLKSKQPLEELSLSDLKAGASRLAGGIAGARAGYQQSKQSRELATQLPQVAAKSQQVWNQYAKQVADGITDPVEKQNFVNRTGDTYEKVLRAFVQKNFLKGGQNYANLTNVGTIENLIKTMAKTTPAPMAQQWQELAKATASTSVGATAPQAAAPDLPQADIEYEVTPTAGQIKPGFSIAVPYTAQGATMPSEYYKKPDGRWYNQLDQAIKQGSEAEKYLDSLIPTQGKLIRDPTYEPPVQQPRRKGKKK